MGKQRIVKGQMSMFEVEDLPLWSGTPVEVQDTAFNPQPVVAEPEQMSFEGAIRGCKLNMRTYEKGNTYIQIKFIPNMGVFEAWIYRGQNTRFYPNITWYSLKRLEHFMGY